MASIPWYHKLYPHKDIDIPEIISNPPHLIYLVDFPHATFSTFGFVWK